MIPQLVQLAQWSEQWQHFVHAIQGSDGLLVQYGITGFGLLGCLLLWIIATRDIRKMRRALASTSETANAGIQKLTDDIEEVRSTMYSGSEPSAARQADSASLNFTRRAQALRMLHRGETPAGISSALQAPLPEVELLLKLSRILDPASGKLSKTN